MSDLTGKLFFSSISLGAAALGVWQTKRYKWKVETIDEMTASLQSTLFLSLPDSTTQRALGEYVREKCSTKGRKVSLSGEFVHEKEVLLGPRSAPANLIANSAQGLAVNPQGYFVITPLKRSDGTVIFVNRGWVGINEKSWGRPNGNVTLKAIFVNGEKEGLFSPENNTSTKKLLWLNPASLLCASGLNESQASPVLIAEVFEEDNAPITSYPIAKRQKHFIDHHVTPMTHLVYALTW